MASPAGRISEPPPEQHPSLQTQTQTRTPPPSNPSSAVDPLPPTSLIDDGQSNRPRDARLIHMILANLGVTAYQERVPLQLMDFAYRYTSSTLQDALHLTSENYGNAGPGAGGPRSIAASQDLGAVTLQSLRLSVESRTHYQFSPSLPKEYLLELAMEKNRVALPPVSREVGLRLPPERYCLTGVGWGLKEEWESEGEEVVPSTEEVDMGLEEGQDEVGGDDARMEDIFGEDIADDGSMEQ